MNYEEFMKYTSPDNDESSIQYVLDMRVTDQIEYLVRYSDTKFPYDEWVKASDLTCYKKIIEYHEGKFSNIKKNLKPETPQTEKNQATSNDNDEFEIFDVVSENNEVYLIVHLPGEDGKVKKKANELLDYMPEIVKYYEKHCFEEE